MSWRKKLSKDLRYHLERAILESYLHRNAINEAKDKGKAQLWIAIAILQKKVTELNLKVNYLEKALQQFFPKKELSHKKREKEIAEVDQILKNIMSGEVLKSKSVKNNKLKKQKRINRKKKQGTIKVAKSL